MKKTAALLATASILLSGCAGPTQQIQPIQSPYQGLYDLSLQEAEHMAKEVEESLKTLPPSEVLKKVEALLAYGLKDPDSAKFRNLRFVKYNGRTVVCGELNAKNSYGGYVGFENFIAGQTRWKIQKATDFSTASGAAESAGLRTYCNLGEVVAP